ncbi:MAG: acyl-CoA thioesterase [Deltaproteobacteria bacterium]|nr:acyl-CoA thioesterase [Deltaproteobacteria bacterium]
MLETRLSLRIIMMPKDTNPLGSIFGGYILSLIDLAATEHAQKERPARYVTKLVREVDFRNPVFVGDVVSFYTETVSKGRSSITIRVEVQALRGIDMLTIHHVTSAELVLVAVDENLKPIPVFENEKQ